MKNTISFIGTVGIPAKYGGFETLAEELSARLSSTYNIIIFCSKKKYKKAERKKYWKNTRRIFIPFKANGAQSVIYDLISLLIAIRVSNTICVFGGSASLFLPTITFFFRKKNIIFHPDGKEWKRKKWNSISSCYLYLSIKAGCCAANYIIVDNKGLAPLFNNYKEKLVFINYGGNQFNIDKTAAENYWLTIARAEPENNLQLIAETFSKTPSQNWFLISNFKQTKFGKHLYNEFNNYTNITFIPATYSKNILENYLSKCKGYIHGHSSGGTNPTLTAAMWLNKPLLCHNNTFNINTTQESALFFDSVKKLQELIKNHYPISTNLSEKALQIAQENYSWEKIAFLYAALFEKEK